MREPVPVGTAIRRKFVGGEVKVYGCNLVRKDSVDVVDFIFQPDQVQAK